MKGGFDASGKVETGGPLVVLYAKNLKELAHCITDASGLIVRPEFDFPGGRRFHFTDPDGYELAVWSET